MINPVLPSERFKKLLLLFWIYTLTVILWGAWVRISHSGDGCGNHWPLCSGAMIPEFTQKKTWIEYGHRLMSGLYGLFVIAIFIKIKFFSQYNSFTKKLNWALLFLMISEALLGAVLVKGELVSANDSIHRLLVMSFHQLNSFLLTGVTYLLYLSLKKEPLKPQITLYKPFVFFLLIAVSGAIASLSTTLFPSISLWQGIVQDFSENSHLFIRLRVLHPIIALIIASGFVIWFFIKDQSRFALEFLFAMTVGIITLVSLSPVTLKLAHLLIAHVLWSRVLYRFVSWPDSSNR